MSDQLKEALSAALDGEADEFELRRVLNETAQDPELREVWARYHLVRDVLSGAADESTLQLSDALGARVRDDLDLTTAPAEQDASAALPTATTSAARRWWQPISGVAVAAAVMLGVLYLDRDTPTAPAEVAETNVTSPAEPQRIALAEEISPADLQRHNAYIMHHVQHTALNSNGVISFVKVATYDEAAPSE